MIFKKTIPKFKKIRGAANRSAKLEDQVGVTQLILTANSR